MRLTFADVPNYRILCKLRMKTIYRLIHQGRQDNDHAVLRHYNALASLEIENYMKGQGPYGRN